MSESLLILDAESRGLLEKLAKLHPEGSKEVFKLVLKTYCKLADMTVRKGQDPLMVFEDLIERICTGNLYRDVKDKIDYLDSILENNHDTTKEFKNSVLFDEIREIKGLLRNIEMTGQSYARKSVDDATPKDGLKLLTVEEESQPKVRKNYKNVRDGKTAKKITF